MSIEEVTTAIWNEDLDELKKAVEGGAPVKGGGVSRSNEVQKWERFRFFQFFIYFYAQEILFLMQFSLFF